MDELLEELELETLSELDDEELDSDKEILEEDEEELELLDGDP